MRCVGVWLLQGFPASAVQPVRTVNRSSTCTVSVTAVNRSQPNRYFYIHVHNDDKQWLAFVCYKSRLALRDVMIAGRLVWFLIAIFFVVAWPLSKLLDCLLGGQHATFYRRAEIKAIVDIHGPSSDDGNDNECLSSDEVLIIKVRI